MEIHLHLAAACELGPWVGHFDWLQPLFNERLEIREGRRGRGSRKLSRQAKGSRKREKTRQAMARITAKVTGRRQDWAEKAGTRLVAGRDLIVFEKLNIQGMSPAPKPRPGPAFARARSSPAAPARRPG